MASKKYKNKNWLKNKLVNEEKTYTEVANELDCSRSTISYWKNKFEIELPSVKKVCKECSNCGGGIWRLESQFQGDNCFCCKECHSEYMELKIEVNCSNCDDLVKRVPSQANSEKYFCSPQCRSEHQIGEKHPRYSTMQIECNFCSDFFERTPSQLAKEKNYCSEECYYQSVQTDRDENRHEYKKWRKDVRNRDDWTCQNCSYRGDRIEAHHIESWKDNPDKRFDRENGLSLCIECHYLTHHQKGEVHAAGLMKGRVDFERLEKMKENDITGV